MIHPIEKAIDAFLEERGTDATLIVSDDAMVYAIVRVPIDSSTPQAMLDIMQVLAETMVDGAKSNNDEITELMAEAVMATLTSVVEEEHRRASN